MSSLVFRRPNSPTADCAGASTPAFWKRGQDMGCADGNAPTSSRHFRPPTAPAQSARPLGPGYPLRGYPYLARATDPHTATPCGGPRWCPGDRFHRSPGARDHAVTESELPLATVPGEGSADQLCRWHKSSQVRLASQNMPPAYLKTGTQSPLAAGPSAVRPS